ncbi:MAG: hypothetical protein JRG83_15570 [Deltaproteobacteria bacterium]|nr:hypothetical protein [Deltaproteobacteria bacterium]
MPKQDAKAQQLQIRVSAAEKRGIQRQAERAGVSMSAWVLARLLPSAGQTFQGWAAEIAASSEPGFAFAELLDWLGPMEAGQFEEAVADAPTAPLDDYWRNYLAATVEHGAALKGATAPEWVSDVPPLDAPAFGSTLKSLRLHLLVNAPPAFLARNLFVDASLGDRV